MAISQDFVPLLNSRNVFIHCLNFCFVFFLFLLVLLDFSFVYLTSRRFSDLRRKSVEWTCKIYYISCILYIQRLNGFSFLCFFPFKLPWRFRQRFRWLFLQYREIETFPIVGHKLDCLLKPFVRASYSALGCCSIAILQPFLYLCFGTSWFFICSCFFADSFSKLAFERHIGQTMFSVIVDWEEHFGHSNEQSGNCQHQHAVTASPHSGGQQ